MILALAAFSALAAEPGDAPWWEGVPVVQVGFLGDALPEESLEPLLQVRETGRLTRANVRDDLTTLYRVGRFLGVEAEVTPWTTSDGELGAIVEYWLFDAPRVSRVNVQGATGARSRQLLDIAGIEPGDVFLDAVDGPPAADAVTAWYGREGFPEARVEIESDALGNGETDVWIRVSEGAPRTVDEVGFVGDTPIPAATLRAIAARAGVRAGRPVGADAPEAAANAIERALAGMGVGPFAPRRGWLEARVTPVVTADPAIDVRFAVEAGPRTRLQARRLGWGGRAIAIEALGLDENVRFHTGSERAGAGVLRRRLLANGHEAAAPEVTITLRDEVRDIAVDGNPGPITRLTRPVFRGARAIPEADLRAVMEQADDAIGRGRYAQSAVEAAAEAVGVLYRARGFLTAEVDLAVERGQRGGRPWARPVVTVSEGPQARLHDLRLIGAPPDSPPAARAIFEAARAQLVGQPYAPASVDVIAQRVTDAWRGSGYLEAETRVRLDRRSDGDVDASVELIPGELLRVRSVTTQGARTTRARFLRREMTLALGDVVSTRQIEATRDNLYALDIFRSVEPVVLGDGAARDVVFRVEEQPRFAYEFGAGVNTDQGIRTFARLTRRNLWGLGHRVDAYGLLGLAWVQNTNQWIPDFQSPTWRAALSYQAPDFPTRNERWTFDLLLQERLQERTWRLARSGLGAALDATWGAFTLRAQARIDARQLQQVDEGALLPGEIWTSIRDTGEVSPFRPVQTLQVLALVDQRDDRAAPASGFLGSIRAEWQPGVPLGPLPTQPLLKSEVRGTAWIPLGGPRLRLAIDAGYAWAYGGVGIVPLEDRFRLGGTGSLRGYLRDGVGPHQQTSRDVANWPAAIGPAVAPVLADDPTRWVPTGGDTLLAGTAELVLPLPVLGLRSWDGWSLAFFGDAGNTWLTAPRTRAVQAASADRLPYAPWIRYSVGAGLRVATPVGPLQIDAAVDPLAIRYEPAGSPFFRRREEPLFRVHLTLGSF